MFDLDVGDGGRRFAGFEGVFAVIGDLETRGIGQLAEAVNQRGEGAVAPAADGAGDALTQQGALAVHPAVFAGGIQDAEFPRRGALDIFTPKHVLQLRAADFAPELVHGLVGNGAEFALQILGQHNAEFAFEQVGHAAFAGLRIDADDLAVFAPNIRGING